MDERLKDEESRVHELALFFSKVHIEDGDCLGEAARELHGLLTKLHPDVTSPEDLDC